MVLFWRLFAAVLIPFILVLSGVAWIVSVQQIDEAENQLTAKIRVLAKFTAVKLEAGYLDQNWPLQDLRTLAAEQDFLFWWIVNPDGQVHLADKASAMGVPVATLMPGAPHDSAPERLALDRRHGYGVLVLPLDTGARRWSFWVGFSLARVAQLQRRIVLFAACGALAALSVLGVIMYFVIRHFLRPMQALALSAEVVGRGDLTHRAQVRTRDELATLAASFNWMVEQLERTTVSRSYVDGIIRSMTDAVIVLDSELRIRTVNGSACRLLGEPESQLLMQPVNRYLLRDHCDAGLDSVRYGKPIINCEAIFKRADGTQVPVLFSASRMIEGHHEVRVVATVRDITELNRMKTELAAARDAALASARHKSEFLANMSHEIRTPMNGIVGMSELLAATSLSAEQREYAGAVRTSAQSLLTIIDDILDLSKVEAGRLELSAVPFAPRAWLDDLLRPLAIRASQKGLEFAAAFGGTFLSMIVADPARLGQVLVNLAANAIKFTDCGEVEIAVHAEMISGATARLSFSVRDTGIGIPGDKLESIFESFTQADGSISRRYGGTGLGLTICSRLVRLMRGDLRVDSEPGRGSRFYFSLELPASEQRHTHGALRRRVLIVGRPGIRLRALERLLAELGADIAEANDADEAECAVRAAKFDFVLVQAPIADERIAQAASGRAVLLETSRDRQEGRVRGGTWRRMLEPVREADLLDLIAAAPPANATPEQRAPSRRILLVEDNAINQKVALRLLEKRGHLVEVAATGEEAIAMAARERYDLILMDVQMPGMSGLEATAVLRSRETASRCPIVALTANAMSGDREACLAAGMDEYLAKPLRAQELFHTIDRLTA